MIKYSISAIGLTVGWLFLLLMVLPNHQLVIYYHFHQMYLFLDKLLLSPPTPHTPSHYLSCLCLVEIIDLKKRDALPESLKLLGACGLSPLNIGSIFIVILYQHNYILLYHYPYFPVSGKHSYFFTILPRIKLAGKRPFELTPETIFSFLNPLPFPKFVFPGFLFTSRNISSTSEFPPYSHLYLFHLFHTLSSSRHIFSFFT